MKRRDFIALVGGAAALGWPFAARAQQPTKPHRVGVVTLGDAVAKSFEVELREGLRQSGLIEGQNLQYEFRAADANIALLPKNCG
jgi:putative ABC transport system substrate-binding protein